jgi:hypothetical protein
MFKSSALTKLLVGLKMVNGYKTVRTQSLDGEIHLVLIELKLNDSSNEKSEFDEVKNREIMKREAQKPLNLLREYE